MKKLRISFAAICGKSTPRRAFDVLLPQDSRSGRQPIKGYLIILFILRRIIIASTDDIHEEQGAEDLEGIDYIRTAHG
jgi:hypothetical protein